MTDSDSTDPGNDSNDPEYDADTPDGDGSNFRNAQESARDLAKLLVSLASAVVTLSATFADKFSQDVKWTILILFLAWALLAGSVVFGVTAISKLVHAQWTLIDRWGEITFPPMKRSWLLFQGGMIALLVYAGVASGLRAFGHEPIKETQYCIVSSAAAPKVSPVPAPVPKPTQSVNKPSLPTAPQKQNVKAP